MYYRETENGQLLQEGINEAGAFSSWIAAATSYSSNNRIMIPFYIYYSMVGFQRVCDLAWAAGDMQARAFLLSGTAVLTTLHGEGLQHDDGHSHIMSAGAFNSRIAAATSYSSNNRIMIPFYISYSMFGFQRVGDLAWAAGDMQARGFLLGGTAGRTTLNGEGLQHEDGHSHIMSSLIPNCISYDPAFAHELAV